jgi:membrane dipeptidase
MPQNEAGRLADAGVFDAHSDLLYAVSREHDLGTRRVLAEQYLEDMRAGGIDMRVTPIFLDAAGAREPATRRGLGVAEVFHREVEATEGLEAATTAADVRTGADSDAVTLILGMEGAEPLSGDLTVLDAFYRLGLRVLGLTHSRRNMAADGSFYQPTRSGTPGGLSAFGVDVLDRCNDLGIVVDVSHLNEPGFWDVVEFADRPFVASHSNCRALHDHPRNLTDEQIRAVADSGGVVGVNALQLFLHGTDPDLSTVVEHVRHAVDVAGIDHVGFGFDFYDYNLDYLSPVVAERKIDVSAATGLTGDADVSSLAAALLEVGFEPEAVRKLLKSNFVRVFETVLD